MRTWLWSLLKWFLFRMDAESAHLMTVRAIRLGIRLRGAPLRLLSGGAPSELEPVRRPEALGMTFRSRLGLAAGFDKNGEILLGLPELGFGFVELGTVTPRPQPGNDRPRLFRDPARQSLFNRMGFNSLGAELVARRLAAARTKLPADFRVGVNVGKNKDTPLEDAAGDYARAAAAFSELADYVVINVSSPNTPGLRSLQTVSALEPIVHAVGEVISRWRSRPPLLLKLAPEVTESELAEIFGAGERWGINGWVLTNTLAGDWRATSDAATLPGGWSGGILTQVARARLREARALTRLPIISVGGIMDADEAISRIELGAELIQIYSGWIFRGPALPAEISAILAGKEAEKQKPRNRVPGLL